MWALGNIAGENVDNRDSVLGQGVLQPLLKILSVATNQEILQNGGWLIANLVRGEPPPEFEKIQDVCEKSNDRLYLFFASS